MMEREDLRRLERNGLVNALEHVTAGGPPSIALRALAALASA